MWHSGHTGTRHKLLLLCARPNARAELGIRYRSQVQVVPRSSREILRRCSLLLLADDIRTDTLMDFDGIYDVAIVGAGPAGSTMAMSLLKRNPKLNILLADKQTFPRDKACGDAFSPMAVQILHKAGFGDPPDARIIVSAVLDCIAGTEVECSLPDESFPYGLVVPRETADEWMLRKAEQAGAKTAFDVRFVRLEHKPGAIEAKFVRTGSTDDFWVRCRLLVGADGASSRVRCHANIASPPQSGTGIAIRGYVRIPESENQHLRVSYSKAFGVRAGGYGWVFPTGENTANIGVGLPIEEFQELGASMPDLLARYLNWLKRLRGLEISAPERTDTHILPTAKMQTAIADRVALIGDASAAINPLSGEGIGYAMRQAWLLASAVEGDLASPEKTNRNLRAWEKQWNRKTGRHLAHCRIAGKAMRKFDVLERMVSSAGAADVRVAEAGVRLMFGDGKVRVSDMLRTVKAGRTEILR